MILLIIIIIIIIVAAAAVERIKIFCSSFYGEISTLFIVSFYCLIIYSNNI